jgi:hypothetical protein
LLFCTCKSCKLRQNQYEQLASSLFVRPEDLLDIRLRCFKLSYALLTPSVYAPVPHPCIHPSGFLFQPCYDSPGGPGPGLYPVTSPVSDTPCHGRATSLSPRPPPLHLRSRLRVHGSRQFILSGPRAGEPARSPSAAPMRTTLPCSTGHLPLQTARAHGPHFQMGSLRPR